MDKLLNEEIFDSLLEKAFFKYEKQLQKTYPDDEELEKEYPTSRKKIRRYRNILKEKEYRRKSIWLYVNRAAVAFLCIISLIFGLVMLNSDVRASVEKVILKLHDKYTEFVFNVTADEFASYDLEDFEIGYIPEDFEVLNENIYDDMKYIDFINTKKGDAMIVIQIFDSAQTSVGIDNEQMTYEKMKIGSNEAWLMYNEKENCGSLLIVDNKFSILVFADLSKEELIKIGENIR